MHRTEYHFVKARLLRPFAAATLSISAFLLVPGANAQMSQPQSRPQTQSPQTRPPQAQSPSVTIPDEKLNAAAAAIGQVANVHENYARKIAAAPESDKQRLTVEANGALEKAVTDQGLSVDEYNSIIRTAQNDPKLRQKLT